MYPRPGTFQTRSFPTGRIPPSLRALYCSLEDVDEYNAFGEELERTGAAVTRFGYQGTAWMRLDSGLYVSPTRLYVPGVGRFGEVDILSGLWTYLWDYTYVQDNPHTWVDPNGLTAAWTGPTSVVFRINRFSLRGWGKKYRSKASKGNPLLEKAAKNLAFSSRAVFTPKEKKINSKAEARVSGIKEEKDFTAKGGRGVRGWKAMQLEASGVWRTEVAKHITHCPFPGWVLKTDQEISPYQRLCAIGYLDVIANMTVWLTKLPTAKDKGGTLMASVRAQEMRLPYNTCRRGYFYPIKYVDRGKGNVSFYKKDEEPHISATSVPSFVYNAITFGGAERKWRSKVKLKMRIWGTAKHSFTLYCQPW